MASTATPTLPSVPVWSEVNRANVARTRGVMLTVLEANWEGDTRSELTVELRLGSTSADSTPRDEVRDELGGDGVEKLGSDRDTKACKIAQELTSKAETLVDLEGAVEVWVIDKTLPSDGRAWFLVKESAVIHE
jgi:hypothetical protein